jgi:hypothetical protein
VWQKEEIKRVMSLRAAATIAGPVRREFQMPTKFRKEQILSEEKIKDISSMLHFMPEQDRQYMELICVKSRRDNALSEEADALNNSEDQALQQTGKQQPAAAKSKQTGKKPPATAKSKQTGKPPTAAAKSKNVKQPPAAAKSKQTGKQPPAAAVKSKQSSRPLGLNEIDTS